MSYPQLEPFRDPAREAELVEGGWFTADVVAGATPEFAFVVNDHPDIGIRVNIVLPASASKAFCAFVGIEPCDRPPHVEDDASFGWAVPL